MDLNSKKLLAILLSIGAIIFLFNLGARDLWEPDETRFAVIAREMREGGNWILPHLNREIYAEKPPLYFWLINLFIFFMGEDSEFVNRLPSTLSGLTTVILTFFFGKRLFNQTVGFLSSLVIATCIFFPVISRWMMLDPLLTLFFVLALYYFYLGYEEDEKRKRHYLLAGLFMGFGVLTKGPVAYLAIPIFFIFTSFQKNLKKFWCRDLLWSFFLSVIIVMIWWVPACWIGGRDYINWILFKQAVGTYVEGGKHFHPKSLAFYFIRFPIEFFPWIVFLPNSFIFGLRKQNGKRKEFLFLFLWFIFIFLFFTFSKGKKDNYLLPLYPASAMMVGMVWDYGLNFLKGKKGFILGLTLLAFLIFIGFIILLSGIPQKFYPTLIEFQKIGLSIFFYLTIGTFLALLLFIGERRWASFISLVLVFTIFHLHISFSLPRELNTQRSMKLFSERILKRMNLGEEIKTYWFKSNGLIYYTKKPYIEEINNPKRFKEVFNSSNRVFFVIFEDMIDQLKKETGIEMIPIEKAKVGHWKYVLISNH